MRKTTLFAAVASVLIATGFGVWAASPAKGAYFPLNRSGD
jgi:hypothetical protein